MPLLWLLKFIYRGLIRVPAIKSMHLLMEIQKLERRKEYDQARILRSKWLKNPEIAKYPELWFSKGNDLLYNNNEPQEALSAYEKAIEANEDFNPVELYYGAACSALMNRQMDKAKRYYLLFNKWWDEFMENPRLKSYYFTNFLGCKNWIDNEMKKL